MSGILVTDIYTGNWSWFLTNKGDGWCDIYNPDYFGQSHYDWDCDAN